MILKTEIIRVCFKKFKINSSIEIHSISEIPGKSGLGSSGAFTAGLIKFLAEYKKIKMTREQIASMACDIEMRSLKRSSGKQYAVKRVLGGYQEININKKGIVKMNRLKILKKNIKKLKDSTLTYFTGITRDSETILKSQKKNYIKNSDKKKTFSKIASLTKHIKKSLLLGNIKEIGNYFTNIGFIKKK